MCIVASSVLTAGAAWCGRRSRLAATCSHSFPPQCSARGCVEGMASMSASRISARVRVRPDPCQESESTGAAAGSVTEAADPVTPGPGGAAGDRAAPDVAARLLTGIGATCNSMRFNACSAFVCRRAFRNERSKFLEGAVSPRTRNWSSMREAPRQRRIQIGHFDVEEHADPFLAEASHTRVGSSSACPPQRHHRLHAVARLRRAMLDRLLQHALYDANP